MRITQFKDFDWKEYRNLVNSSVSKKFFIDYELTSDNVQEFDAFYVSEKYKILYIPISKNASTSLKKSLDFYPVYQVPKLNSLFDLNLPTKYKVEYKIIVIIREPKERWISGFNEFLSHHSIFLLDKDSRKEVISELKNKKYIFDGHTLPQFSFIDYCFQPSEIDFDLHLIKMDKNIEDKLSSIIGSKVTIEYRNHAIEDTLKIENYKYCEKILNQYCLKDKNFIDLYNQDLLLYNQSK